MQIAPAFFVLMEHSGSGGERERVVTVHSQHKPLSSTSVQSGFNQESAYKENAVDSTWICTTVLGLYRYTQRTA